MRELKEFDIVKHFKNIIMLKWEIMIMLVTFNKTKLGILYIDKEI